MIYFTGTNTHILSGFAPQPVLGVFLILIILFFIYHRVRYSLMIEDPFTRGDIERGVE